MPKKTYVFKWSNETTYTTFIQAETKAKAETILLERIQSHDETLDNDIVNEDINVPDGELSETRKEKTHNVS